MFEPKRQFFVTVFSPFQSISRTNKYMNSIYMWMHTHRRCKYTQTDITERTHLYKVFVQTNDTLHCVVLRYVLQIIR